MFANVSPVRILVFSSIIFHFSGTFKALGSTVEPVMNGQPPMGGHSAIPQNDILYTNEPPTSSHLH